MTSPSQQTTPTTEESKQPQQQTTTTTSNDNTSSTNSTTTTNNASNTKRKPSRRANTAERRATHNAVERARRETLNSRFLDLAALLPNLSQIRRPSKSAIVNSSIAHIHASRRHRLMGARELRTLKAEADALRRELNEWRDRAALPRIEEPQRGEGFSMVLSGELEAITVATGDDDEAEDGDGMYDHAAESQQPFYHEPEMPPQQPQQQQQQQQQPMFSQHGPPTPPASSHGYPGQSPVQMMNRGPMNMPPLIVNSQQVHFDPAHPANMHGMPQFTGPQSPHAVQYSHENMVPYQQEKAWSMGFAAAQRSMQNHAAAAANFAQHQQGGWHDMLPSDDSSSASSEGRARSGSLSTNGFGSPPRSPGSFDMGGYDAQSNYELAPSSDSQGGSDYGVSRGLSINTAMGPMAPQMVASPVGNGGGGFGNGIMGMM